MRLGFGIWVLGFGISATLVAGCAKAQARSAPDGPPLQMPAPPARVLAPVEEPVTVSVPSPETPPPTAAAPAPRTPPARTPPRRPETERPDPAAAPSEPAAPEPRE